MQLFLDREVLPLHVRRTPVGPGRPLLRLSRTPMSFPSGTHRRPRPATGLARPFTRPFREVQLDGDTAALRLHRLARHRKNVLPPHVRCAFVRVHGLVLYLRGAQVSIACRPFHPRRAPFRPRGSFPGAGGELALLRGPSPPLPPRPVVHARHGTPGYRATATQIR